MKCLSLFLFLFGACIQNISAQEEFIIQDYILFNNYPYFVSMNQDGDILEFLETAPEIMKGASFDYSMAPPMPLGPYNRPKAEYKEFISPLNTSIVSDGSGNTINEVAVEEAETMVMQTKAAEGQDDKVKLKPKNEPEFTTNIIRTEKANEIDPKVIIREQEEVALPQGSYSYNMKFPGFNARLTPDLILVIEDIAKIHSDKPDLEVEIKSFITAGDPTNITLAENRMKACKDLLETYGVPSEKISTEIQQYRSSQDAQVNITMINN